MIAKASKTKWDDNWYVKVYQLAKGGMSNQDIATTLGVSGDQFKKWKDANLALQAALKEARQPVTVGDRWIFGRLSPRAQECWRRVLKAETLTNATRKIEFWFGKYGDGIRKELFLHVMAASHFNTTKACRRVNIPHSQFKRWCAEDFEFANLLVEMQEHRSNFYDEKFNQLVDEKEPSVVIHAQKTFNREKGFGDKLKIEHSGEVKNTGVLEIGEKLLDLLSRSARKELMQAMEQLQLEQEENTVDAIR